MNEAQRAQVLDGLKIFRDLHINWHSLHSAGMSLWGEANMLPQAAIRAARRNSSTVWLSIAQSETQWAQTERKGQCGGF